MAVIYAEIGRIKQFQELWEGIPQKMEASISDRDDCVTAARNALNKGISNAEEIRDAARAALNRVQDELEQAKRSEDGPSEYLYRAVEGCERAYEFARRQLEKLEEHRERFDEESARDVAAQDQALAGCKSLGKKGGQWVTGYIQTLQNAKRAIYEDVPSGSGSFLTPDGGYVGARDMTEEEMSTLGQKTGWSKKTLKKCQLRPDGSVWLKTNNSIRDSETYNGTWFERDTVYIGGIRVEGIFPKFDAAFEPESPMPEALWKGGGSNYDAHFAWCRTQLKAAVESNPALAAGFTAAERKLIAEEKPLPGYTWHHHQKPGKMQMVRSDRHSAGMHGVGHTGGNALWCTVLPDD